MYCGENGLAVNKYIVERQEQVTQRQYSEQMIWYISVCGGNPFSSHGDKAMFKGLNVIAGFRDQPVDDEEAQQKRSKNSSNDELNHCFVMGTMN